MIPYTVDRRADTGVTNVTMGIWLFLASEVMLFGALFSAYTLLRVSAPQWPHGRELLALGIGMFNTLILLGATTAVWRARQSQRLGPLAIASVLALVFLALKSVEYTGELARGLRPAVSTFLAMYYTLTGFHAAHVAGGIIANLWIIAGAKRTGAAMTAGRLHAVSLYWTFVDVIWMIVFVLLYLS